MVLSKLYPDLVGMGLASTGGPLLVTGVGLAGCGVGGDTGLWRVFTIFMGLISNHFEFLFFSKGYHFFGFSVALAIAVYPLFTNLTKDRMLGLSGLTSCARCLFGTPTGWFLA